MSSKTPHRRTLTYRSNACASATKTCSCLESIPIRSPTDKRGALNAMPGDDELFWNIIGHGWTVPIDRARVSVVADTGAVIRADCFSGAIGSTARCSTEIIDGHAEFGHSGLQSYEGVTIAVTVPDIDGEARRTPEAHHGALVVASGV